MERERHRHLGTSAPEKDCANYAHCCWHNLILPHGSQPYPLARYVTHWTLVLQLLYLWLAVYSTYMGLLSPNDKAVLVGRVAACLGGLAALVFTWNVE